LLETVSRLSCSAAKDWNKSVVPDDIVTWKVGFIVAGLLLSGSSDGGDGFKGLLVPGAWDTPFP
jgi:hypothetical protein